MKTFATLALGTCMTVALTGAGFAQSMSNMTATEKTTMTKCQGMSDSAMKADSDCTALMKKYPDMAKSGTSGSGMSGGGMSGGTQSPTGSGTSPGSSSR